MNKRKILIGLGYVVGGVCILGLGYFWGYREGLATGGFSASMVELQSSAEGMALQLKEGTCETAKQTIIAHDNFLEKYKEKNNLILPDHTYHGDKMLGHMRLFLIERHLGNQTEAAKHLKAAAVDCQRAGLRNCSETYVVRVAETWNQRQPMGCLASQK
jgi:hypothetical protein